MATSGMTVNQNRSNAAALPTQSSLRSKLPVFDTSKRKHSQHSTSSSDLTPQKSKKFKGISEPANNENLQPNIASTVNTKPNTVQPVVRNRVWNNPRLKSQNRPSTSRRQPGQPNASFKALPKFSVQSVSGRASCIEVGTSAKKQRPKWDFKGRLQDTEDELKKYKQNHLELQKCHEIATQEKQQLEAMQLKLEAERLQLKKQLNKGNIEKIQQTAKIENLMKELAEACQKNEDLQKQLQCESTQKIDLQSKLERTETEVEQLKQGLAQADIQITNQGSEIQMLKAIKQNLEAVTEKQASKIADLENRLQQSEEMRRYLHNEVQELKGNIRVYCRIRPLIDKEVEMGVSTIKFNILTDQKMEVLKTMEDSQNGRPKTSKLEFTFDRIFNPSFTQDKIFEEISHLIQSCIDGYNVCIFAYGQTGSGKTYTMEGSEDIKDFVSECGNPQLGMIPRAVKQIFTATQELQSCGWSYRIEASILEIYNETIQDLLVERVEDMSVKHEIRMADSSSKTDVYVTNLSTVKVETAEQVYVLLRKARKNRAVAANKCNEYSSRSHCVFSLKLSGNNRITNSNCRGQLNLVDLAGSERLKESCSEGVRFTEMKNINLSLSNLGNVIMALAKNADHVPYRNSKLTHLLMPSLGGNSKTLMFVNVCPKEEFINETLNSLRFAMKVNQCHIGMARKN